MSKHFEFRSIKIKDQKPTLVFLTVTHPEDDSKDTGKVFVDKDNKESDRLVHKDFNNRLQAFGIHFLVLCGYMSQDTISPDEMYQDNESEASPYKTKRLENVKITGISISGDWEDRSVIISASMKTEIGKVVNTNTPLTKVDEEEKYLFQEALGIDIDLLIDEATLYLRGEKDGEVQLDLFDSDADKSEEDGLGEIDLTDENAENPWPVDNSEEEEESDEDDSKVRQMHKEAV